MRLTTFWAKTPAVGGNMSRDVLWITAGVDIYFVSVPSAFYGKAR